MLVYACGSSIKFFDSSTNKTDTFLPECLAEEDCTNGICILTASAAVNKFAYSETKLSPCIYVHDVQKFDGITGGDGYKQVSVLKDGAEIEYLSIEFSNGEAILALSNIPNMEIIIW